jgi:hypothetical protein
MKPALILDCSMTMAWCFADEIAASCRWHRSMTLSAKR